MRSAGRHKPRCF